MLFRFFFVRTLLCVFALSAASVLSSERVEAATNNNCYVATGAAVHTLCWLDLTGSTGASGSSPFTWKLPDGSVLSANIVNSSTTAYPGASIQPAPPYPNSELGTTIYTGIAGDPVVYGTTASNNVPANVSNISLASSGGVVVPNFTMVGADAESTDSGDGAGTGSMDWTTTGGTWAILQHSTAAGQGCTIQIGGSVGTGNAQCLAPTTGVPSDVYLLSTALTTNQSFSMHFVTSAYQGYAFAIELAQITLNKTIVQRVATGDQFTVNVQSGTATPYTASTTGTGTTATTGPAVIVPGETYTISETASNGDLASYASSIACTNATTGSTTVLPRGKGTSFTFIPSLDDKITCTFTNTQLAGLAKTVTNVTTPNGTSTADTGKPGDDLQYGLTFTNSTGAAIVATSTNPIVISDTVPANTTYLKYACTTPQNGLTCTVSAPAVGSTLTTITYTFIGTLAVNAALVGTFDVLIK